MSEQLAGGITQLLAATARGEPGARDRLWATVYDELYRLARSQTARERHPDLIHATTLVNEVYLRLGGNGQDGWDNRHHFFAAAANAMRRIRVDYARKRQSLKRGGGSGPLPLLDSVASPDDDPAEVLAFDEALTKLEAEAPRAAEVVKLRYFSALSVEETATVLAIAPRTVEMDWRFARAWLRGQLADG